MQLIGITGAIGHGKTSLADSFASFVPKYLPLESGRLIAELIDLWQDCTSNIPSATDLRAINLWLNELAPHVTEVLAVDCTAEQLQIDKQQIDKKPLEFAKLISYLSAAKNNPALVKSRITAKNKQTYRPLLQWLGGFLVERLGDDVWYKELVRRARSAKDIELCTISGLRYPADAKVIRRAGGIIVGVIRPSLAQADLQDPTESQRHNISCDATIVNDGSLEDLKVAAQKLYANILTKITTYN